MGEVFSEEKQEMDVPQGSVLSVTLFNIKTQLMSAPSTLNTNNILKEKKK